jgi:hypothetical protein
VFLAVELHDPASRATATTVMARFQKGMFVS